jgi:hypothetical protein
VFCVNWECGVCYVSEAYRTAMVGSVWFPRFDCALLTQANVITHSFLALHKCQTRTWEQARDVSPAVTQV